MNEQDTLISKYLAGEASPEEAMALEDWMAAAPGNREQFMRLFDIASAASGNILYKKPEPESAWQDLLHAAKPARWVHWKWILPGSGAVLAAGILLFMALKFTRSDDASTNSEHTTTNAMSAVDDSLTAAGPVKAASNTAGPGSGSANPVASSTKPAAGSVKGATHSAEPSSNTAMADASPVPSVHSTGKNEAPSKISHLTVAPEKATADNRIFDFRSTLARDAFHALEKGYKIRIVFTADLFKKVQFTGYFDNRPLQEVLDIMSRALEFEYQITDDGKVVSVSRKGDQ